jgi:hypothetical protein
MRSTFKNVLVAALAVFATGIVGASSASAALPEFTAPYANQFEVAKGGTHVFATVGKRNILCLSLAAKGEITGAKVATATLTLKGCGGFEAKCTTAGAATGEIKTAELEGKPAYINNQLGVGVDLQAKGGGNFAEFACGAETVKIRGSVIGAITPVNVPTSAFYLNLTGAGGVQNPTEYENEKAEKVKDILETEGTGPKPFAFEQTELSGPRLEAITSKATQVKAKLASRGLPEFEYPSSKPTYPIAFEGHFKGPRPELQSANSQRYEKAKISGLIVDPNDVANVVITFEEVSAPLFPCTNLPKSLVTRPLAGRLGYINKVAKTVGLLLEPTVPPIANCKGGVVEEEYNGSVIAKITPVNEGTTELTLHYEVEGVGTKQRPEKFEGEEALHHLETIRNKEPAEHATLEGEAGIAKTETPLSIRVKA